MNRPATDGKSAPPPWHALPLGEVLERLGSRAQGLEQAEAEVRQRRYGLNVFQRIQPVSAWRLVADQFRGILVMLLVAAMLVSLAGGERADALAIGAVLVLNAAIGFFTELRAHRSLEGLLSLEVSRARVRRDGRLEERDARDLVPGDVIEVEAGSAVPADARLLAATDLRAIEAALTGESLPANKRAEGALPAAEPLASRRDMLYKATTIATGHARAVVVATGMDTEVGRIGALVASLERQPTPLQRRLEQLGQHLVWAVLAVAAGAAGLGFLRGAPLGQVIQTGLALAVAAIPEGLPAVATITLALGVRRMASRRALIRRLHAVEALGSATVICADKTGTLTAGELCVTTIWLPGRSITVSGSGYEPTGGFMTDGQPFEPRDDIRLITALRIGALASTASLSHRAGRWTAEGDPTEVALLVSARKAGLEETALRAEWPQTGHLPFSSERMLMATFHESEAGTWASVKGAPAAILPYCTRVLDPAGASPLSEPRRQEIVEQNQLLASRGLRVLALAEGPGSQPGNGPLADLTFVGLVGMTDSPAPGVAETVARCREAGIRTLMVTGDQRYTAEAVARELNLVEGEARFVEGSEVDAASDERLRELAGEAGGFSRVSPEAKLRIVAACQARGEVVAMLGDGVNDAAALRKADIGVVMGQRGTDLAKEAADLVLTDDRFVTIGVAIEEGRVVFDNIRKFVLFLFSCNLAEILVVVGGTAAGYATPLLPLQILWLNLLTDTAPALALALEPGEADLMRRPPRAAGSAILSAPDLRTALGYALLISVCSLGAFAWALSTGRGLPTASSLTFMTLGFGQLFHLGNVRHTGPVLAPARILANRAALAAVLSMTLLQVLAVQWRPLADLLGVRSPSGIEWLVAGGLGLLPGVVGQGLKLLRRS